MAEISVGFELRSCIKNGSKVSKVKKKKEKKRERGRKGEKGGYPTKLLTL